MDAAMVQLLQSLMIVFSDSFREVVDGIFLHSLSHGDDDEMFPVAASLIKSRQAQYVVVNGSNGEAMNDPTPGKAWTGKDDYIRRLEAQGVKRDQIVVSDPSFNTRESNAVYLKVARDCGWRSAITLNQPQQLLRATLGQVRAMDQADYKMRVYAVCPRPWDAQKIVFGQQGGEQLRRFDLIEGEIRRVFAYQLKGDLATFYEFFAYMAKRSEIR